LADARASVITKLLYVLSDRHPRAEDVVQVNVLGTCGKHGPIKTLASLFHAGMPRS
jgi:hypothetical protein